MYEEVSRRSLPVQLWIVRRETSLWNDEICWQTSTWIQKRTSSTYLKMSGNVPSNFCLYLFFSWREKMWFFNFQCLNYNVIVYTIFHIFNKHFLIFSYFIILIFFNIVRNNIVLYFSQQYCYLSFTLFIVTEMFFPKITNWFVSGSTCDAVSNSFQKRACKQGKDKFPAWITLAVLSVVSTVK